MQNDRLTGQTPFVPVVASLEDLVGTSYCQAVCAARAWLVGDPIDDVLVLAQQGVGFLPDRFQIRQQELLSLVGQSVSPALSTGAAGATTAQFAKNAKHTAAPLSALGIFRVGEDGRLYLSTKSEHYHAPLGHCFPGYRLLELARWLGIPNATHNNTRGHITRLLEERLTAAAGAGLECVLNLETGSLAVEAALKMILARFYQIQDDCTGSECSGMTPVVVVLGNDDGGLQANYHGTTILTQAMRGMWPELLAGLTDAGLFEVACVRPNNYEDLEMVFAEMNTAKRRVAGFFHEIVMMNYGGLTLERDFLHRAYALARQHGAATVADEIQSCLWSPELFMFRELGLDPDFVAVGKGFPGGEYPASRLIFNSRWDCLPQFGALVTNGQEELASLAYLVTMHWACANANVTAAIGDYYQERLHDLHDQYPGIITRVEGRRHLAGIFFDSVDSARHVAGMLAGQGIDISVQTYKASCPPSALTKLPLIAGREVVDFLILRMKDALESI